MLIVMSVDLSRAATVTEPTSRGGDLAEPQRGGQPYQMCTHGGHMYAWRP